MSQQSEFTLDVLPRYLELKGQTEALVRHSIPTMPHISVTADIDALEDEWRAFECYADCTPFQTFDWLSTWQRHIGVRAGVTPVLVLARSDRGELLFILPLAIEQGYIRKLTFLGHGLCDYNAPLLSPNFSQEVSAPAFAELWKTLRAHLHQTHKYDIVLFDKMPEFVGIQRNPICAFPIMPNPSSAHVMALGNDWEQFYSQKRSPATRRNDRKKWRKLTEFGEVRFVTAGTPEATRETVATLVAQKSRQFRRMGISDLFAKPGYAQFFESVAVNARALVHVSALQLGSTYAAANLGLTFRGWYYHVLASHDEGPAAHFGPGAAHLRELMRYAIGRGCTHFDFTIGDEPYKLDWSDTRIELYDYVSGVRSRGHFVTAVISAAFRIKRFIKNSPVIWRLACRLRRLRCTFGS